MTTAGNDAPQHIRAAEQLGGKLNMTLAQLLANTGGTDRLSIDAQQLVAIDVNSVLGSPYLHLGNARGAAASQPKVTAHANRADIDDARHKLKKAHMVECRHRRRKGNGHHHIDPSLSQGMQAVGRRHQFLSGRRAHHDIRIGIKGDYDRLAAAGACVANDRVD